MDNISVNQALMHGNLELPGVLPHLAELQQNKYIFTTDFGLEVLPEEPGVIIIRGPRQYGKSTWLEWQIFNTIKQFGAGSALYLNGDEIIDAKDLADVIRATINLFSPTAASKRLFIDEITAISNWEKTLKRLIDAGELKDLLIITTGSKASDLRHGIERLPGRKGKLKKTNFIFTPISYAAFKDKCGVVLENKTLLSYILSGGSPMAANAIATDGRIPEYITATVSDWILGEFAASNRSRAVLLSLLQNIYKMAGNPVGQAKLARECDLANNTVAQGYINLLQDLMCVIPCYPANIANNTPIWRKPCKYHFTNLLAAITWHPQKPRTVLDLQNMQKEGGAILEWTVAQELWRRTCLRENNDLPEYMLFWQSKNNELDFYFEHTFIEVKSGQENPMHYSWFTKVHPKSHLLIINKANFKTKNITGITLEDFLLAK